MIEKMWVARALGIISALDIPKLISEGNKDIPTLAMLTSTNPDALFRLMRMLSAQGVFRLRKDKCFELTNLSKSLIDGPGSLRNMVISHSGTIHWRLFQELPYSLQTGKSAAEKVLGTDLFSYAEKNDPEKSLFIEAMAETSDLMSMALFAAYDFSKYPVITDIGGGNGRMLALMLDQYPTSRGILFDRSYIVETAKNRNSSMFDSGRLQLCGGDFFSDQLPMADLYLMKNILHDWDDEKSVLLLKNLHRSIPRNARLLIVDSVIKNDNSYSYGKMIDILMLVVSDNGRERTREEFEKITGEAGFTINRIIPTVAPFSIIECIKK
jgi:hypothetical protein